MLFELALLLAETTGRRIGSIRGLRWSDFSLSPRSSCPGANVRWVHLFDKRQRETFVDVDAEFVEEVMQFRSRLGVVGDGWLFPSGKEGEPLTSDLLGQWLRDAMRKAGMQRQRGEGWHSYHRKWATESKLLPDRDAQHAGGWVPGSQTYQRCYQQPDSAGVLTVMRRTNKLRGGKLVAV